MAPSNARGGGLGALLGVPHCDPEFRAAAGLWWWYRSPGQYFRCLLAPRYVCIYLPAESSLVVPHCDPRLGALGSGGVLAMFMVLGFGIIF